MKQFEGTSSAEGEANYKTEFDGFAPHAPHELIPIVITAVINAEAKQNMCDKLNDGNNSDGADALAKKTCF